MRLPDVVLLASALIVLAVASYSISSSFPQSAGGQVGGSPPPIGELVSDIRGREALIAVSAVIHGLLLQYVWIGVVVMLLAGYSIAYPLESGFARLEVQAVRTRFSFALRSFAAVLASVYASVVSSALIAVAVAFRPDLILYAFVAANASVPLFAGLAMIAFSAALFIRRTVPSLLASLAVLYLYDALAKSFSLAPYSLFTIGGDNLQKALQGSVPVFVAGIIVSAAALIYAARRWEV